MFQPSSHSVGELFVCLFVFFNSSLKSSQWNGNDSLIPYLDCIGFPPFLVFIHFCCFGAYYGFPGTWERDLIW